MLFFRGQTYTQFSKIVKGIGMVICSENLFYRYQRALIIPAIEEAYNTTLADARQLVANRGWWLISYLFHSEKF